MAKLEVVYEVFIGVDIECAAEGCTNRIIDYAIRKNAVDRRVWCLDHHYLAREAGAIADTQA